MIMTEQEVEVIFCRLADITGRGYEVSFAPKSSFVTSVFEVDLESNYPIYFPEDKWPNRVIKSNKAQQEIERAYDNGDI